MSDLRKKREAEQSEAIHKTVEIISGLVPGGTSVYKLFTALVKPLHEKRFDEWVKETTLRLHKLEQDGKIDLKELSQNNEFNTIITKATLLAQQNHQEEKIDAFRNIVLNSSKWLSKDESIFDWSHKFLLIVDQISPLHILLLKTFRKPAKVAKMEGVDFDSTLSANNSDVFFKIYPNLKDRVALANQCWKELYSFGFVARDNFLETEDAKDMVYHHSHGVLKPQTTDFGNKFLNMVENED